jgi:hypothetical protein
MDSYKNLKFPVCDNIVKVRSELVVAVYIHDVILLSALYPGCCDMTHTLPTVVQPPDSHTITTLCLPCSLQGAQTMQWNTPHWVRQCKVVCPHWQQPVLYCHVLNEVLQPYAICTEPKTCIKEQDRTYVRQCCVAAEISDIFMPDSGARSVHVVFQLIWATFLCRVQERGPFMMSCSWDERHFYAYFRRKVRLWWVAAEMSDIFMQDSGARNVYYEFQLR